MYLFLSEKSRRKKILIRADNIDNHSRVNESENQEFFTYPTNNPGQENCGCDESENRIAPGCYSDNRCALDHARGTR